MGEVKYLARYGRVWQRIGDKKTLGNELSLEGDDKITNYMQVSAKPDKTHVEESAAPSKRRGAGSAYSSPTHEGGHE